MCTHTHTFTINTRVHTYIHAHMHSYTHIYTNEHACPIPILIMGTPIFGTSDSSFLFSPSLPRRSENQFENKDTFKVFPPRESHKYTDMLCKYSQGHRGMRIQVWLLIPGGVRILLNDIEDKVKFHKLLRVGHYGYPGTLRNSVTANHTSPAIFFLLPPNLPSHHKSPPHLPHLKNLSHNL